GAAPRARRRSPRRAGRASACRCRPRGRGSARPRGGRAGGPPRAGSPAGRARSRRPRRRSRGGPAGGAPCPLHWHGAAVPNRRGGTVRFVGTKKQARDAVKEVAESAGMPYVNHRWLGGLLTNYQTISLRIKRLHDLERYQSEGQLDLLPTRERMNAQADLEKLQANLGGVKNMQRPPNAMFVVDLKTEVIAVKEAQRLRIPIIGLVDTNCDPDGIDYVIPGNDDAIRACALITSAIGDVVREGQFTFRAEEEAARREAEEQARREAEERARREAEEQAAREAAEQAERERQEQLVSGGEGEPRQDAEAEVAEAAQAGGRPQPD